MAEALVEVTSWQILFRSFASEISFIPSDEVGYPSGVALFLNFLMELQKTSEVNVGDLLRRFQIAHFTGDDTQVEQLVDTRFGSNFYSRLLSISPSDNTGAIKTIRQIPATAIIRTRENLRRWFTSNVL